MSDGIRFDQLVVKLLSCALEATTAYKQAIADAEEANMQNVAEFLRQAQAQDEERTRQAIEVIQSFFTTDFW